MHGQQPPDLNALGDLAELDLHTFAVGELDAEPFSSVDVILRDLQAALGPPEPTHAVRQPRRAEPDWVTFNPSPTPSSTFSSSISRPSNSSSQWPPCSSGPMIGMRRATRQPGWSRW